MRTISIDLLYFWADEQDIRVVFSPLRAYNTGLLGMADVKRRIIKLDVSLRTMRRLLKCVLAHEIGHFIFPPRPGHIRYHSCSYINIDHDERSNIKAVVHQDERLALKWATSVLMPNVEFNRIIESGNYSVREIADHFDVDPLFVRFKINYYMLRKPKTRWRDLIKKT
jgi:Zn-dependent peptidase ImmA (M78 family)